MTKAIKENCVFFAINDGYVFALANVLMSMKKYSAGTLSSSDIIIYHTDITPYNQNLLTQIWPEIEFCKINISDKLSVMLKNEMVMKWGVFIIVKLFGFELIKKYKKVLHLDADLLIQDDISYLFKLNADMAWRKVLAWNPGRIMNHCLVSKKDYISAPSGGVILFSNTILKYQITEDDIIDAFYKIEDCKIGGIDELIFGYLAYKYKMNIEELPITYNDPVYHGITYDELHKSKIIHFLDYRDNTTKPWKSLAAYLFFEEWRENNIAFEKIGGSSTFGFNKKDYYNLFSFDKIKMIAIQKEKIRKLESEIKEKELEILDLKKDLKNKSLKQLLKDFLSNYFINKPNNKK